MELNTTHYALPDDARAECRSESRLSRQIGKVRLLGTTLVLVTLSTAAQAQGVNALPIKAGDTAWMLAAAALVMFMTPGLALFYGGMVRAKNVLGTIMHSFVALAIITFVWIMWGYSLAFGPDFHHIIGDLSWFGLRGVGLNPNPTYNATIPHEAFMIYQMMFAIITPALISGAVAERIKFKTYIVFLILWSTFVYCPLVHCVWGAGGFLKEMGVLDFAGAVIHISSGTAALVLALMLGKRRMEEGELMRPHNLTMTLIGTAMLWFGWFGFNAGSAGAANAQAVNAFVATHISAAIAALVWMILDWKFYGKPTVLGAATGAVAGLVGVTPGAGYVSPMAAVAIGAIVALICFYAVTLKNKFGYDDTLDVFGVHGVGGIWGAIAAGIFATYMGKGLIAGNPRQVWVQLVAVVVTAGYSMIVTWIIGKVLDRTMGLRVEDEYETVGLDQSQHGESGYEMFESSMQ